MNHYAAILNLEDADSYCLQHDDLFEEDIQGTLEHSILLGHGQTEYAAMMDAFRTLQDNGMLKTYECKFGADCILKNSSGTKALRHLWLYDIDDEKKPTLYSLPGHSSAVDFCSRYNLPEEAVVELSLFISALLDPNE